MSVTKDVLADFLKINEDDIKCENCIKAYLIGRGVWHCIYWDTPTPSSGFCSCFEVEKND